MVANHNARSEQRQRAVIRARMRDSRGERDVQILDISSRGCLARTSMPPARGEFVEIRFGKNQLAGQVRWSGPERFGLALRDRIKVDAVLEGRNEKAALQVTSDSAIRKQYYESALFNPQDFVRFLVQWTVLLLCAGSAAYLINKLVFNIF